MAPKKNRRQPTKSPASGLVPPHGGGPLRPLLLTGNAFADERRRAQSLPRVPVTSREKGDLIMLGIGGFTPLEGFMTQADWKRVCGEMMTASGLFWPIPITLSTDKQAANRIKVNSEIALTDQESGAILATMKVREKYVIDKDHECRSVFRTGSGFWHGDAASSPQSPPYARAVRHAQSPCTARAMRLSCRYEQPPAAQCASRRAIA